MGRFACTAFFQLAGMKFAGGVMKSEEAASRELVGADCADRNRQLCATLGIDFQSPLPGIADNLNRKNGLSV